MRRLLVTMTVVALAGCAVTRSGKLARIPSGPTIPVQVTVRADSATVMGVDPATGERLEGTFVEDVGSHRRTPGGPAMPAPGTGGPVPSGDAVMPMGPSTMNFRGELKGDQGTTLRCVLQVEKRLRIRGHGLCHVFGSATEIAYRLTF